MANWTYDSNTLYLETTAEFSAMLDEIFEYVGGDSSLYYSMRRVMDFALYQDGGPIHKDRLYTLAHDTIALAFELGWRARDTHDDRAALLCCVLCDLSIIFSNLVDCNTFVDYRSQLNSILEWRSQGFIPDMEDEFDLLWYH